MAHVIQDGTGQAGLGQVVEDVTPEDWELFEGTEDWELPDGVPNRPCRSNDYGACASSVGVFTEDPAGFLGRTLIEAADRAECGSSCSRPFPLGKWLRDDCGVPMREAKTHLSRLATYANDTGESIRVMRNGAPWFEIRPLAFAGHRM